MKAAIEADPAGMVEEDEAYCDPIDAVEEDEAINAYFE